MVPLRGASGPRSFLPALALLALLVVVACGEPDRSNDFGALEIAAGEPVVLGISVALTGDSSGDAQRIERGARLAVEQAGMIKGHPLAVSVRDDRCSAEGSIAAAEAFTASPDVIGVVGPMCSRGCVPASLVYEEAKLLMVTPSCTASVLNNQGFPTVLRIAWNGEAGAIGGAAYARQQLKASRVFAINDSTFYGKQQRDAFKVVLKAEGGRLIADEYIDANEWDFTELVAQIAEAQPDLIYYAGFLPAGRFLIQQIRYAGIATPFMGSDSLLEPERFIAESTTAAEGAYVTDAKPIEGKKYAAFARAYRERWGEDPGAFSAQGYDAATVLIEALKDVAKDDNGALTVDKKALRDAALETDRQGASGRIRFYPNGERIGGAAAVIKRVRGDGFETVKEFKPKQ